MDCCKAYKQIKQVKLQESIHPVGTLKPFIKENLRNYTLIGISNNGELISILSDDDCSGQEQGAENIAEVESTTERVNVCQVLSSQIDSEVTGAKQLELQNWVKEDVYDEVTDQG